MNRLVFLATLAIAGCTAANGAEWRPFGAVFSATAKAPRDEPPAPPQPTPPPEPAPQPTPKPAPVEEPSLALPDSVAGDIGTFIKVAAKTNGAEVRWLALDKGLAVFPGEMLKTSLSTVVTATTAGNYRLLAYTAVGGVPSDPVTCMVVVNGPQPPPAPPIQPVPPTPPQPPVPPVPPVVTAQSLWIIILDDVSDQQSRLQVAALLMGIAAQGQFPGHQFANVNSTNTAIVNQYQKQIAANGGKLPCVVLLDAATRVWLNTAPGETALPATLPAMNALVAKYAKK